MAYPTHALDQARHDLDEKESAACIHMNGDENIAILIVGRTSVLSFAYPNVD
jgi:hypothetical protein